MAPLRFALLLTAPLCLGPGSAAAQDWLDTRAGIEEFSEAGDSAAAESLADGYIEDVRLRFGETSRELPDALLQLAGLQVDIGEPVDAAETIREAIELLVPLDSASSTALIDAHVALGEAYASAELHALAIEAYEQARDLSRRKLGLYNEEQIGILYDMSRAALDSGDATGASVFRQEAHSIHRRVRLEKLLSANEMQSDDPDAFLDARLDFANALRAEGLTTDAMRAYNETLEIIDEEFDKSRVMRARVLLDQSTAFGTSLPLIQRARRTVNFMVEPDPELRAAVLRTLGDWRLSIGRPDKAARAYQDSWQLLENIEGGEVLQEEWFGEAQFITEARNGLMGIGVLTVDPDAPLGLVALDMVIDRVGRARSIRVVSADPQWMAGIAIGQVANSLFRPRFEDGMLVTSPGRYYWSFRYDPVLAESFGLVPVPVPETQNQL